MATIRHPITHAVVDVPDSSLPHLRQSGWETLGEWNEREAARMQREADQADADAKAAKAAAKDAGGTSAKSAKE